MIISRTPYRISFFGGGTDYPDWYLKHGGSVLATTINKYCYLTCRFLPPFFEHRIRIVYSKIEMCQTIDEIVHPSVRECLRYLKINRGLEIHHDGDVPARCGLGSSSSFTVGLVHALHALTGYLPSRKQLAEESIEIEQNCIKETVGSQDQISVAFGGFNHITFSPNGWFDVRPITLPMKRLEQLNSHLMLFYTGIRRTASDVAESYVKGIDSKRRQLRLMNSLVEESIRVLNEDDDIDFFGELLNESWEAKRSLSSKVSNPEVDHLYQAAKTAGAIGGKITGAGGGGFLLLFVPPERQLDVRQELCRLIQVPFKFEFLGSQIIFVDRQEDFSELEEIRSNQNIREFREVESDAP